MLNDSPVTPRAGKFNLFTVLILFFGLGFVVFAILSIYAFGKEHTATTTLYAQKTAAAKAAAKAQYALDKENNLKENESPYRSYTAPEQFGSFVVHFPKNWSSTVDESEGSSDQVDLVLNPDSITSTDGNSNPVAAEIILRQKDTDSAMSFLNNAIKKGNVSEQDITVSGIKGTDVTGTFPDGVTLREVFIPVRDKTIVISNQDADYANEFSTILSQMKINP